MTANARIPIDLNDPKIPLAVAGQKSFQDAKRETIYLKHLLWVLINGYLPREIDFTTSNGVMTLYGRTSYMLHNSSRSLVRDGLPEFPVELDYCNVQGHNLEDNPRPPED